MSPAGTGLYAPMHRRAPLDGRGSNPMAVVGQRQGLDSDAVLAPGVPWPFGGRDDHGVASAGMSGQLGDAEALHMGRRSGSSAVRPGPAELPPPPAGWAPWSQPMWPPQDVPYPSLALRGQLEAPSHNGGMEHSHWGEVCPDRIPDTSLVGARCGGAPEY